MYHEMYEMLQYICHAAWQRELLSGFNGNVSVRQGEHIFITCSGAAKGYLRPEDICCVNMQGLVIQGKGKPSSELSMHIQTYTMRNDVMAMVHCHPKHLLALEMRVTWEEFLRMPIFEAEMLRARVGFAKAAEPGSMELAMAVATTAHNHDAIWMSQHGLSCIGTSAIAALALAEELEHLAQLQLLSRH